MTWTSMAVLLGAHCYAAPSGWQATGPFGGSAELVRVVPKRPNMVLAATSSGLLYQSLDGGVSWANRFFPAQFGGVLHALEVDPRVFGTWYAGVESENHAIAGVYKTADAGTTWESLPGIGGRSVWEGPVASKLDRVRTLNAAAVLSAGTGICPQLELSRVKVNWVGTDQSSSPRPLLCGSSTDVRERRGQAVKAADQRAQFRRVEVWIVPGGADMPSAATGLKEVPVSDVKRLGCPK